MSKPRLRRFTKNYHAGFLDLSVIQRQIKQARRAEEELKKKQEEERRLQDEQDLQNFKNKIKRQSQKLNLKQLKKLNSVYKKEYIG